MILVTGALPEAKNYIPELESKGFEVEFMQMESDALPVSAEKVEAVICNGLFLHHKIEEFTSLKMIQLTSAGYDRVPMDYCREHNITVFNARGVYSVPMAEFALCGVLCLYKRFRFFNTAQKAHRWDKHRGLCELFGKNVCIVGSGNVGTECAKRFGAMGCKVAGVDLFVREDSDYDRIYPLDKLWEQLEIADVTVLTLPLTDETRGLIGKNAFDKMKSGSILVNIARGAVVDTGALIEALETNQIGGAVLDVFDTEPLDKDSPLWDMENAIVTPHNSFVGNGNKERLYRVIDENLSDYLSKE